MAKFLANENVPAAAVRAARHAGYDVSWVAETSPGAVDEAVLAQSTKEGRVLVTFDKDFGKLAFQSGRRASCGVILFRPRLRSPDYLAGCHCLLVKQCRLPENTARPASSGTRSDYDERF